MPNYNRVILMGNLTRDPEPIGDQGAKCGMAVNRKWTSKDGQQQEETLFIDLVVWGRQAEVFLEYLAKGRPVHVEGRLQLEKWEDRETGAPRSKHSVTVERFQLMGSRDDSQRGQAERPAPRSDRGRSSQRQQQRPPRDDRGQRSSGRRPARPARDRRPPAETAYNESYDYQDDGEAPF